MTILFRRCLPAIFAALALYVLPVAAAGSSEALAASLLQMDRIADSAPELGPTTHSTEVSQAALSSAQDRVLVLTAGSVFAILLAAVTLAAFRVSNRHRRALHEANEQLLHLTRHDGLTGLIGRSHFRERLDQRLAEAVAGETTAVALLLIDLDRFKQVNDVHGHHVGDAVLVEVAKRLRTGLGQEALIGRLGGDEFAAILPAEEGRTATRARAERLIASLSERFVRDEADLFVGASIGIAMLGEDGETASQVTTNADLALYEAKRRGRGTSVLYRPAMRAAIEERAALETDLARALERGELKLHYQPIVDGRNGRLVFREALMRWDHPTRGLLYPGSFIPLAENRQIIQAIGGWLVRSACMEASRWEGDVRLAINISTFQLADANFLKLIVEALAASELPADRLMLELNESIFSRMDESLKSLLQSLRLLGVRLALDHFGRGNSSLSFLEEIDFAMIKIDRGFVQSAAAGLPRSQAIVSAIVSLAASLGLDVAAEGIETEEQAGKMRELGCAYLQGFLYGRPAEMVDARPGTVHDRSRAAVSL